MVEIYLFTLISLLLVTVACGRFFDWLDWIMVSVFMFTLLVIIPHSL